MKMNVLFSTCVCVIRIVNKNSCEEPKIALSEGLLNPFTVHKTKSNFHRTARVALYFPSMIAIEC